MVGGAVGLASCTRGSTPAVAQEVGALKALDWQWQVGKEKEVSCMISTPLAWKWKGPWCHESRSGVLEEEPLWGGG